MKISKATVDALLEQARTGQGKPESHLFDDTVPGLRVRRVGAGVSYTFSYRIGGRQRSIALGKASIMSLTKARETAARLYAQVKLGGDPAEDKARARAAPLKEQTFAGALEPFLKRQEGRLRPSYLKEVERYLVKYSAPLHDQPLNEIDRRDIATLRIKVRDAHGAASSNGWRAAINTFFSWAMKEGLCDANPVIATNKEETAG
ncbi:MAG: integrase arm-type DNA-binding domain-containing protein, partial [Methylocystis sp.]